MDSKFHCEFLNEDIESILNLVEVFDDTETKLAVNKDDTINGFEIEDISYTYSSLKERDDDYNQLIKLLNKKSKAFIYSNDTD